MIKRIVKMTFQPEKLNEFFSLFEEVKNDIAEFEGCHHLELWQDKQHSNVLFTYSIWDNEQALNKYRFSSLFKSTWSDTKILFSAKPEAWSLDCLQEVDNKL
jgi:quinol monooxygenase YgiN